MKESRKEIPSVSREKPCCPPSLDSIKKKNIWACQASSGSPRSGDGDTQVHKQEGAGFSQHGISMQQKKMIKWFKKNRQVFVESKVLNQDFWGENWTSEPIKDWKKALIRLLGLHHRNVPLKASKKCGLEKKNPSTLLSICFRQVPCVTKIQSSQKVQACQHFQHENVHSRKLLH